MLINDTRGRFSPPSTSIPLRTKMSATGVPHRAQLPLRKRLRPVVDLHDLGQLVGVAAVQARAGGVAGLRVQRDGLGANFPGEESGFVVLGGAAGAGERLLYARDGVDALWSVDNHETVEHDVFVLDEG